MRWKRLVASAHRVMRDVAACVRARGPAHAGTSTCGARHHAPRFLVRARPVDASGSSVRRLSGNRRQTGRTKGLERVRGLVCSAGPPGRLRRSSVLDVGKIYTARAAVRWRVDPLRTMESKINGLSRSPRYGHGFCL